MANPQVKVKALQPVAHGNLSMHPDRVYTMNRGDAEELEKRGFVKMGATGESEGTQVLQQAQKPEPGDVVADDAADILGAKMDTAMDNKMAKSAANKTAK